jgi:hypothetical protein
MQQKYEQRDSVVLHEFVYMGTLGRSKGGLAAV